MTTQETIDDANAKLAAAESAYNSAISSQEAARASMQDWYNLVIHCKGPSVQLGNLANRNDCQYGTANNNPGCASKSTCESNIDSYNSIVTTWRNRISDTANKKVLLDAAVAYKDKVIANASSDPTFIAQQQQNANTAVLAQKKLDADKAATRNKIIAIVVIVIVIVAAVLIWKKLS